MFTRDVGTVDRETVTLGWRLGGEALRSRGGALGVMSRNPLLGVKTTATFVSVHCVMSRTVLLVLCEVLKDWV